MHDLGAEFVQPRVQPLIVSELMHYGIDLEEVLEGENGCEEEDSGFESATSQLLLPIFSKIDAASLRIPTDCLYDDSLVDLDIPWGTFLRGLEKDERLVQSVEKLSFPFSGAIASEISALGMLREVKNFGGTLQMFTEGESRVRGGVSSLPLAIAEALPAGTLALSSRVLEVLVPECERGTVTVRYTTDTPTASCGDTAAAVNEVQCKALLLAVPFNALHKIAFGESSNLPAVLSRILNASLTGHCGRVHKSLHPVGSLPPVFPDPQHTLLFPAREAGLQCLISLASPPSGVSKVAHHDWCSDADFLGTWMAPRVGQLEILNGVKTLSGSNKPWANIRFIGADWSPVWPGWMEGAIASGKHAAMELIKNVL